MKIDNSKFFDVRTHQPQKGQALCCYSAMAELINGVDKEELLALLCSDRVIPASQMMLKMFHACEADSIRVPKEIVQDLLEGFSFQQVLKKKYKYKLEMFFYAAPEDVPIDSHWSIISLLNLDDFLEKVNGSDCVEEGCSQKEASCC